MSWVRVESSVARHRKFQQAGPAASWLWICGLAYCQEGLTDGFIPFEALQFLGMKSPRNQVARLVTVGLWEECQGGWRVHDYLAHNKSAAEMRRILRERQEGGKQGGRPKPSSVTFKVNGDETLEVNLSQNPDQIRSDQKDQNSTAQSRKPPARSSPIHDTSHRNHAFCGRVCMPRGLFDEFVRRRNTLNADTEIIDWALSVDKDWSDGGKFADTEPGDAYQFWKTRYAEMWPAAAASKADSRLPAWARPGA